MTDEEDLLEKVIVAGLQQNNKTVKPTVKRSPTSRERLSIFEPLAEANISST